MVCVSFFVTTQVFELAIIDTARIFSTLLLCNILHERKNCKAKRLSDGRLWELDINNILPYVLTLGPQHDDPYERIYSTGDNQ